MPTVNSGSALRSAIQAVGPSDPIITLAGIDPSVSFSSAVTLGKQSSTNQKPVAYTGYTIQGAGSSAATSATLQDTRIYQQNTDSAFLPGTVQNLTLNYSSSSNGRPLLSIEPKTPLTTPTQSLTIKNVDFTGTTTGWDSNGNLYMSLRSFSNTNPLKTTFTLDKVNVSINGQIGGSAFFHNWNNSGIVTIKDSTFDEAGFRSSFNFYNFGPLASTPTNVISGNTFKRTTNATVRSEGNLLGNVNATLTNNTFQDGAYVDLIANVSGITFNSNTFTTITDGYGIRATPTLTGTPTFSGLNTFNGPGLALKYNTTTPGSIAYSGTFNVNSQSFSNLVAGSEGNDTMNYSSLTSSAWISGDIGDDTMQGGNSNDLMLGGTGNDTIQGNDGNDTILGGDGNDTLFGVNGVDVLTGGNGADRFRWTNNGSFDTITDFTAGEGDQISLTKTIFRPVINTPQTLTAANFFTTNTFTASGSTLSGRVTSLTGTSATTAQVNALTGVASSVANGTPVVTAGYYFYFDGTSSKLVYDADWRDTAGRQFAFNLTNITTQVAHDALGASQFFAL